MTCATKNISLKVNSEEFPQISSNDETSLNSKLTVKKLIKY